MLKNATAKEKLLVVGVAVALLVLGIYWFGIKKQNEKYVDLVSQRSVLEAKERELDALKESNQNTTNQIAELNGSISDLEKTFLPELNNECINNYLLNVMEKEGSPYLSNIEDSTVVCDDVYLPDGTVSTDKIVCHRFKLEYAATDGYCVPQYNETPKIKLYNFEDRKAMLETTLKMGNTEVYPYNAGYSEFIAALKKLEELNPDCVKLHSVSMEAVRGFNMLVAEIDFYALDSYNRVSDATSNLEYVNWNGNTDVQVGHGIIGQPLYVSDVESAWYGCGYAGDLSGVEDRPFAAYYSIGMFYYLVDNQGLFMIDPEMDQGAIDAIVASNQVIPVIPTLSTMEPDEVAAITSSLAEVEASAEEGAEAQAEEVAQ